MKYDIIIGLEIHAELKTNSKMFCSCLNNPFSDKANNNVCPICLGHPGTLPVPNKEAIEKTIMTGLAIHSKINRDSKFDRKNYFYPDLPKGYQISQFDMPLCYGGYLEIDDRQIPVTRIHLEEDTGKSIHKKGENYTLIDFNRAGTPLMEMVTEPLIKDAKEAKKFCQEYQKYLRYLDVSEADMEKGEMRCEANVSLQEKDSWIYEDGLIKAKEGKKLNPKVEVKNINSFKSVERAIDFEIKRQSELLDNNEQVLPETRGFDEDNGETKRQRIKETSADYRYFPEPDIPPLEISEEWLKEIHQKLPEMPDKKIKRFIQQYGITEDSAILLSNNRKLSEWYESAVSELGAWIEASGDEYERLERALAKSTANLISTQLLKHLKEQDQNISDIEITPENFAELVFLIFKGKINSSAGQKVLTEMLDRNESPIKLVKELGLEQIDNEEELKNKIKEILDKNQAQVEEYKNGKTTVIKFLLGQVMAATKGKANPKVAMEILEKLLS
ncbi:MAG: Asp-tRNA(Asn)/Glu-tRNA(Gln) amidotransferase subunit GatB [Patescibacteria group bacterium]|jgi:aspartyl-tRNA(Asn)/glutamyl-tRNA(Gln) amidotransferase subunit B|nr:Asp-tRNA(Asn)/Glu-tRNA(Gln) amidotransferase subunit GatB [Patescibacteria group bacterium]